MMTSEVVTRQRLQLLALFLIVATLCHFAARTLLAKTAAPDAVSDSRNGIAEPPAKARAVTGGEAPNDRKLSDRTGGGSPGGGISLAKIAELKMKYYQRMDLWFDDSHANPLILDLAGIPRDRLPELEKVVSQMNEKAVRDLKTLVKADLLNSNPGEGSIAFTIPASEQERERTKAALRQDLTASFGADAAEIMTACAPQWGNSAALAGCEISGVFAVDPQNPDDLKLELKWKNQRSAGSMSVSNRKEVREKFGDLFDDLLKSPQ